MTFLPQVTEDCTLGYGGNLGCLFLNTTGLRRHPSKSYVFITMTCLERCHPFKSFSLSLLPSLSLFFYLFESVFLSIGSKPSSIHMITVGVVIK